MFVVLDTEPLFIRQQNTVAPKAKLCSVNVF